MRKIRYKKGMELWQYPVDSIVSGVPISYFNNDVDAMAYRKKVKNKKHWVDRMGNLAGEFDKKKVEPIYYCLRCRRMEDGAHRINILPDFGIRRVSVRIGAICYVRCMGARILPGDDTTVLRIYQRIAKTVHTSHVLDPRWLEANANDKWPRFEDLVDFRGKTVLDIGCNTGYSCVEAWARGAILVTGMDTREDVIEFGGAVKRFLKIGKPMTHRPRPGDVKFRLGDWSRKNVRAKKVDIVMCLGLLHYFPEKMYGAVFDKLCAVCKETLVLELRVTDRRDSKLVTAGKQTLPTVGWIEERLHANGFSMALQSKREKRREVWVAKRRS